MLVRVRAAGLNPLDYRIRRGDLRGLVRSDFPVILGADISGLVEAVGAGVTRFVTGDEVIAFMDANPAPARSGFAKPGGYAELAVTREDTLAHKPASMSHLDAATLPIAALTARQALSQLARLQAGERVLIHGASGGVGLFAIQVAKRLGAHVTATCGAASADFVMSLGADDCILRTQMASLRNARFDVIYDVATKLTYAEWTSALSPRGRFISNVFTLPGAARAAGGRLLQQLGGHQRYFYTWVKPDGATLELLAEEVQAGRLHSSVEAVYDLSAVVEAHRRLEAGGVRGKLALEIGR